MAGRKKQLNTALGGNRSSLKHREITANPQGSREERRAAERLAKRGKSPDDKH